MNQQGIGPPAECPCVGAEGSKAIMTVASAQSARPGASMSLPTSGPTPPTAAATIVGSYVSVSSASSLPVFPACSQCQGPFRQEDDEGTLRRCLNPLVGDLFYKYTCSKCSLTEEAAFERLPLSWINVIRLVLFHLHQTDRQRVGFFRWKEDICQLIEERWETLLPLKSKTASWMNSVSSVLSANSTIFISGFEKLKQPGWWALRTVQPPRPPAYAGDGNGTSEGRRRKRRADDFDELLTAGPSEGDERRPDPPMPRPASAHTPLPATQLRSPLSVDTAQKLLLAKHYVDRIPNVSALLPLEQEATPTTVRAAQEIKRKLVERLLRVDSKLLQEALVNAPPSGRFESASLSATANISFATVASLARPFSTPPIVSAALTPPTGAAISTAHPVLAPQRPVALITPHASNESKEIKSPKSGGLPTRKELKRLQKMARPANYVRASPHENELLEMSLRVINPDPTLNRFKRKLIMRRAKRRAGLAIFDLDQIIYKYLKSSEPLLPQEFDHEEGSAEETLLPTVEMRRETRTYYDVPYVRDPTLSFRAKLLGVSNVRGYPFDRISPFSGLRLPAYLHREERLRSLKLRLFDEMRQKGHLRQDAGDTDNELDVSNTVDFAHVRKEFIPQVNRLLRKFFWPSVDMTESLDYPDYGIVVLYRKLVIGCAFVTPDAYITYFLIHPEWANAGLGSILLYLLITRASPPHLDITLHVSATNPAMLLYQKFGFKPEEYIVNFYDKYYRDDENTVGQMVLQSKNAFLIRLRR